MDPRQPVVDDTMGLVGIINSTDVMLYILKNKLMVFRCRHGEEGMSAAQIPPRERDSAFEG
jgi:CBS domain-containing protein